MDGDNTKVGAPNGTMTLTDNATGKSIELPVIEGSIGPKVIDVRKLYAQTGYFTYDPGFMATAACRSRHDGTPWAAAAPREQVQPTSCTSTEQVQPLGCA